MTAPSSTQQQDDRRRRPVLLWLGAVTALLLLAVGGAALVIDGDAVPESGGSARRSGGLPPVIVGEPAPVTDDALNGAGAGAGVGATALGLRVEGTVRGELGPGSPAVLVVTVSNPLAADVLLTSATGRVTATDRSGCSAGWYRVGAFAGDREVSAGDRTSLELPVTFLSDPGVNQDACKGATYRFSVDVRGRQA